MENTTLGEEGNCSTEEIQRFCAEQIQIPPQLPNILKQYTKAAIRTQPRCLLAWSAAYFRSLADGKAPLAKDRMEYPGQEAPSGLTAGGLRALHRELGTHEIVSRYDVERAWRDMTLDAAHAEELFEIGSLGESFPWIHFLGLAAGTLGKTLIDTMKIVCEVMTTEPDGAEAYVEFRTWWQIYKFMANIERVPMDVMEEAQEYLSGIAEANFGRIGPRNFVDVACPQLQ